MTMTVFTLSDATGHTAESVVNAVTRQFEAATIQIDRLPRVTTPTELHNALHFASHHRPCLIAYTFVIPELRDQIAIQAKEMNIPVIDLLGSLIEGLSDHLGVKPRYQSGLLHVLDAAYFKRMEAIEFAIKFDDGKDPQGIMSADVVLIGVSRTSKTPTCMYLAQNKGIRAGNIPIVMNVPPPRELFRLEFGQVIGLVTSPEELHSIRSARLETLGLPTSSDYANYQQIIDEIAYGRSVMDRLSCPVVNVSHRAVEETASEILTILSKLRGIH